MNKNHLDPNLTAANEIREMLQKQDDELRAIIMAAVPETVGQCLQTFEERKADALRHIQMHRVEEAAERETAAALEAAESKGRERAMATHAAKYAQNREQPQHAWQRAPVLSFSKPGADPTHATNDATNDAWWLAWCGNRQKHNKNPDGTNKAGRSRLAWTDADLAVFWLRFSTLKQRGFADAAAKTAMAGDLGTSSQSMSGPLKKCLDLQANASNQPRKKVTHPIDDAPRFRGK